MYGMVSRKPHPGLRAQDTSRPPASRNDHVATFDRSDVELGIRIMVGRTTGAVGVGAPGVLVLVRYTMPVPVLGLSLVAPEDTAFADELRVTGEGLTGDREGNETPSCGGALVAMARARVDDGGARPDCGCRSPWEGIRRIVDGGVVEGPVLEERDVRVDVASPEDMRRLPCVCGRRRGRGTVTDRVVDVDSAGDG